MIIILPIGKFNVDNLIRFTITLFVNFMVLLSKDQIVEGSDASSAQFPSQVSLRFGTLGHYCGGSLLTLNDVLTAAHCASYGIRMMRRYVVVVAGEVKSEKKNSLSRQESTVKSVAVHPLYDCKSFKNDIAIIKFTAGLSEFPNPGQNSQDEFFATNALISSAVQPSEKTTLLKYTNFCMLSMIKGAIAKGLRCESNDQFNETSYVKPLPRISSKPEIGQECYVVGWGSADPTLMGEIAETLQYTLVGIKHGFACDSFDKKQPYFVEEMICAEALMKRGVCMGDSGGPLICANKIAGVISSSYFSCMIKGSAGRFTNVAYYNKFIDSIIDWEGSGSPPYNKMMQ